MWVVVETLCGIGNGEVKERTSEPPLFGENGRVMILGQPEREPLGVEGQNTTVSCSST
jgi:hypothetical protein